MVKCVECTECAGFGTDLINDETCTECNGSCHQMVKVKAKRKARK